MEPENLSRYPTNFQKDVNLVRQHLQVVTLADITYPNGKTIAQEAYEGRRQGYRKSPYEWPRQPHVTTTQAKR